MLSDKSLGLQLYLQVIFDPWPTFFAYAMGYRIIVKGLFEVIDYEAISTLASHLRYLISNPF